MAERLPDKLRRKWSEIKGKIAKWLIRKSVQWLDKIQEKSFLDYGWLLDEVTNYHVIAERSLQGCHVFGTKVEYYDAPQEVTGDD